MAVSKDKKRLVVTLEASFAAALEAAAKRENRSISNYLETILRKYQAEITGKETAAKKRKK